MLQRQPDTSVVHLVTEVIFDIDTTSRLRICETVCS